MKIMIGFILFIVIQVDNAISVQGVLWTVVTALATTVVALAIYSRTIQTTLNKQKDNHKKEIVDLQEIHKKEIVAILTQSKEEIKANQAEYIEIAKENIESHRDSAEATRELTNTVRNMNENNNLILKTFLNSNKNG